MKPIPFDEIEPGMSILIEKDGELFEGQVVSTTRGHLGLPEVRLTTGEVYSHELTPMYKLDPTVRTDYLLRGEKLKQRAKRRVKPK